MVTDIYNKKPPKIQWFFTLLTKLLTLNPLPPLLQVQYHINHSNMDQL